MSVKRLNPALPRRQSIWRTAAALAAAAFLGLSLSALAAGEAAAQTAIDLGYDSRQNLVGVNNADDYDGLWYRFVDDVADCSEAGYNGDPALFSQIYDGASATVTDVALTGIADDRYACIRASDSDDNIVYGSVQVSQASSLPAYTYSAGAAASSSGAGPAASSAPAGSKGSGESMPETGARNDLALGSAFIGLLTLSVIYLGIWRNLREQAARPASRT